MTLTFLDDLISDFKRYTDPQGLIQNRENPGVGETANGMLYTAHYVRLLKRLDQSDLAHDIAVRAIQSMKIVPGLFWAKIGSTEGQSVDNYTGIISMAHATDLYFTLADVRDYSKKTWWFFDINNPYKKFSGAYLGRFMGLRAQLQLSLNQEPCSFLVVSVATSIATAAIMNPRNQDEWFLSWHLIETYRSSNFKNDKIEMAIRIWKYRFKQTWNDLGEVATVYWNKEHPLAKWLPLIDINKI